MPATPLCSLSIYNHSYHQLQAFVPAFGLSVLDACIYRIWTWLQLRCSCVSSFSVNLITMLICILIMWRFNFVIYLFCKKRWWNWIFTENYLSLQYYNEIHSESCKTKLASLDLQCMSKCLQYQQDLHFNDFTESLYNPLLEF